MPPPRSMSLSGGSGYTVVGPPAGTAHRGHGHRLMGRKSQRSYQQPWVAGQQAYCPCLMKKDPKLKRPDSLGITPLNTWSRVAPSP